MPRYYRRRYYRRRPRRYIRRWFRRRFRRYVNGSSKSSVRIKTAVEDSGTLQVPDATTLSPIQMINAFGASATAGGGRSVLASPLYRTYCGLYEECKCIGMRVSLSIASQIGGTALPSLQIYTAWDRRHGSTEAAYTAQEIKNSATYNVATALNNNVAKLTRSIYASDLMEKAQWHDCSYSTAVGNYVDNAYNGAAANPNFFCPALFFCFGSPSLAAQQSPATVAYQISTVYYFAFRNPKFGAAAQSKLEDLGERMLLPDDPAPAGGISAQGSSVDRTAAVAAQRALDKTNALRRIDLSDADEPGVRRPVTSTALTSRRRRKAAADRREARELDRRLNQEAIALSRGALIAPDDLGDLDVDDDDGIPLANDPADMAVDPSLN